MACPETQSSAPSRGFTVLTPKPLFSSNSGNCCNYNPFRTPLFLLIRANCWFGQVPFLQRWRESHNGAQTGHSSPCQPGVAPLWASGKSLSPHQVRHPPVIGHQLKLTRGSAELRCGGLRDAGGAWGRNGRGTGIGEPERKKHPQSSVLSRCSVSFSLSPAPWTSTGHSPSHGFHPLSG